MSKLLRIQQLSYSYPNKNAFSLHDINFSLKKGEILAIAGESGSGKSTLLQLIAGLLDPAAGSVYLHKEPVTGPTHNLVPGHPDIKVIFQHFKLSPKINVYHNIAYLLNAYTSEYKTERVQELIRLCKLEGKEEKMPHELSGGEQQRLAIARALAEMPKLILMDEPFSNMDSILKDQLKEDILDILKQTDTTAIIVSHDMVDALSVADTIAVMHRGSIVQLGSPSDIYHRPVSPYVARLFGPCNFFTPAEVKLLVPSLAADHSTIGIRAEHVYIGNEKGLAGKVVRQHFMGAFREVTIAIKKLHIIAHDYAPDRKVRPGNEVFVQVDENKILYFD